MSFGPGQSRSSLKTQTEDVRNVNSSTGISFDFVVWKHTALFCLSLRLLLVTDAATGLRSLWGTREPWRTAVHTQRAVFTLQVRKSLMWTSRDREGTCQTDLRTGTKSLFGAWETNLSVRVQRNQQSDSWGKLKECFLYMFQMFVITLMKNICRMESEQNKRAGTQTKPQLHNTDGTNRADGPRCCQKNLICNLWLTTSFRWRWAELWVFETNNDIYSMKMGHWASQRGMAPLGGDRFFRGATWGIDWTLTGDRSPDPALIHLIDPDSPGILWCGSGPPPDSEALSKVFV